MGKVSKETLEKIILLVAYRLFLEARMDDQIREINEVDKRNVELAYHTAENTVDREQALLELLLYDFPECDGGPNVPSITTNGGSVVSSVPDIWVALGKELGRRYLTELPKTSGRKSKPAKLRVKFIDEVRKQVVDEGHSKPSVMMIYNTYKNLKRTQNHHIINSADKRIRFAMLDADSVTSQISSDRARLRKN